jgi:hypothetical protein
MKLAEAIQQHFGYPSLLKVDPNTQHVVQDSSAHAEHKFSQAAIPSVLIGLYKYTLTDIGAQAVLSGGNSSNWAKEIFPGYNDEVIKRIAHYSGESTEDTGEKVNEIAAKAVEIVRNNAAPKNDLLTVKNFMAAQRTNILPYLPAALHIGELVQDPTIDDKTNKMEGPISSFMHAVGDAFSTPDKDEKVNKTL